MRVCAENLWKVCGVEPRSRPRNSNCFLARITIERPSGVSSASEASCAASASSCAVMPGAGWNEVAWRSPSVIVPVLSSSRTSTSPAASTARPDEAMTLARIIRSMPAMPIADRSPPMVVGIRQTSSAIRTVSVTTSPLPAAATAYSRERRERRGRQQEHEREESQQDRQRDLVGRAAALRAFDHGDHPVEKALPLPARDAHDDPVGQHPRAARHRGEISPGFPQHGR